MKQLLFAVVTITALSSLCIGQDNKTPTGKTIIDIKKQVDASDQKKNITVTFDAATNRSTVSTGRIILGRQDLFQQSDSNAQDTRTSVPSWEVFVYTAFTGQSLPATAGDFAWRVNVYNPRFPQDSELKVKVDGEELSFKPARAGRAAVSNIKANTATPQLDKTQNSIEQGTDNLSDAARPVFLIYVLKRADINKILQGTKVKLYLSKQLDVNLLKELKGALDVMLNVTNVQ